MNTKLRLGPHKRRICHIETFSFCAFCMWNCLMKFFSDFMIDAVKNTNDSLIPELVLFFQNSTSEQRGSLSSEIKTSQTTSISSQTKSNQPLKPNLYLLNQIANLLNHICYLSNHITNLLNQIVPFPNHIIPLSNHIMMWFGRFFGCRKCSRSHRKWNFQKRKLPVISVSHKLPIRLQCQNHSRLPLSPRPPITLLSWLGVLINWIGSI